MSEKVFDYEEFKKQAKRAERKQWFKDKIDGALIWADRNKETILTVGPAVLGIATVGVKTASKHAKLKKEKDLKDLYCYDRSLGHYWRLKRELSNSEWIEIDQRKKNGERLADILSELKVLK